MAERALRILAGFWCAAAVFMQLLTCRQEAEVGHCFPAWVSGVLAAVCLFAGLLPIINPPLPLPRRRRP